MKELKTRVFHPLTGLSIVKAELMESARKHFDGCSDMGEGVNKFWCNIVIQSVRFVLKMILLEILLILVVRYCVPTKI